MYRRQPLMKLKELSIYDEVEGVNRNYDVDRCNARSPVFAKITPQNPTNERFLEYY